jgi:hypothetical protein
LLKSEDCPHQDRYFHFDLQSTVRDMEGGIYEKLSAYLGTFARTELLTCAALQTSLARVQVGPPAMLRIWIRDSVPF